MSLRHWKLNDKNEPEEVIGLLKWAESPRSHVRVAETVEGDAHISTVFIGLEDFFTGSPIFETMIFGGPLDMYQERCGTWAESVEQHALAVERHKHAIKSRRIKDVD